MSSSSSRPSGGGTGGGGRSGSSSSHHHSSSSSHSHHTSSSQHHVVAAMPSSTRGVSLSLPLLEGLCQRPESARMIVNDALDTLEAAQRISKFVVKHYHRRRRRKQQQQQINNNNNNNNTGNTSTTNTSSNNNNKKTTTPAPSYRSLKLIPYQQRLPPHQHWLWDAMRSSSRAERHVAARILLTAVDQRQQQQDGGGGDAVATTTASSSSSSNTSFEMAQWKLQHVLMALWNQHILSSTTSTTTSATSSSLSGDHNHHHHHNHHHNGAVFAAATTTSSLKQQQQPQQQLPSNIPMEWMALLKHVVLGSKMVTEERIMAFCLGGIPWITRSIWQLVTSLNNNSNPGDAMSKASFAPTQIQALIGLVELCYSVLLVVFIEPDQPTTTTTATTPTAPAATTNPAGSGGVGPNSAAAAAATTTNSATLASAATSSTTTAPAGAPGSNSRPSTRRLGSAAAAAAAAATGGGGVTVGSLRALALAGNNNSATTTTTAGSPTAGTTATTSIISDTNNNKDSSATAVAKRLTLRRRVLKRLFWKSMDNSNSNNNCSSSSSGAAAIAHPHHHHHHNNNSIDVSALLSPLACLIGAFHIWKTNTDWPYPGPTADACLTMLKQLVDPTSTAKAVSLAGLTAPTPTPTPTSTTTTATLGGGGAPPPPPPPPPPPAGGVSGSSYRTTGRDGISNSTVNSIRREQRRRKRQQNRSPGLTTASATRQQQQQQQQAATSSAGTFLFRTTENNRRNTSATTTGAGSGRSSSGGGVGGGGGIGIGSGRPTAAEIEAAATDGTVTRLLSSVLSAHTASAAAVRHSQSDPEDDDDDDDDDDDEEEEEEVMDVEEEDSEEEVIVHDDHHHHHHHEEDNEDEEEENDNDDNDIVHDDVAPEHDEEIDSDEAEHHDEDENEAEEEEENENHEDDDEEEEEDDDDEDDDDADDEELGQEDEGLVLHDDDVARFEGLLELNEAGGPMEIDLEDIEEAGANGLVMAATSAARSRLRGAGAAAASSSGAATSSSGGSSPKAVVDSRELTERKRMYLQACMQVLAVQHPPVMSTSAALSLVSRGGSLASSRAASRGASRCTSPVSHSRSHRGGFMSPGAISSSSGQSAAPPKCFSLAAEQSLLESAMGIVRPPKKPVNTKMIMRRAPTQEEFFRGSLSRNPISLSMLKPSGSGSSGSGPSNSGDVYEPTVRDLRQHIADDLQMSDSAELLELLVANKILDVNLKLRVVHQVLWKNHLMENSHSGPATSSSSLASLLAGSGAGAPSFFSTGSGLSMMFSSGLGGISVGGSRGGGVLSRSAGGQAITADTPLAALPPLVVTYRLAGVDGEATEDTVSTLVDPEAPSDAMSPAEVEQLMEKEYGITRIVTEGRGVYVLLRSVEFHIQDVLRRIRRDDVSVLMEYGTNKKSSAIGKNESRNKFKTAPPYPGLALLRCCAKLPSNRKKLLQARAPTILLRLLLDVLNALEDPQAKSSLGLETAEAGDSGSNETGEILQELIEALASDISTTAVDAVSKSKEGRTKAVDESMTDETTSTSDSVAAAAEGQDQDATTLSLVLASLESISLSPPLRNIIAKLLPFLTYGQVDLSRELALNFARHIDVNALVDDDKDELPDGVTNMDVSNEQSKENEGAVESPNRKERGKSSVLMEAFVQASMTLPSVEVCNSLRSELISCGFIHRLASFVMKDVPSSPPPWSAALLPKEDATSKASPNKKRQNVINSWREFFQRQGIKMAFNMLIGLCKGHPQTQAYISQIGEEGDKLSTSSVPFLRACHWMEATSDNASNRVYVRGVGLLAETLMDELMEDNDFVAGKVKALRRATRERKKEIAQARRSKALLNMSSFGSIAGGAGNRKASTEDAGARAQSTTGVRNAAASLLAPVFGLFQNSSASEAAGSAEAASSSTAPRSSPRSSRKRNAAEIKAQEPPNKKPAWVMEMENLEDEEGLVCSVCQEGRTLQPSELLGLYAYVKKVSLPVEQCGSRDNIDGATLLRTLPSSLPKSMVGTHAADQWYVAGKAAGDDLRDTARSSFSLSSSVSSSRRSTYYTTTVSASNAIHFSCHQRARQADRNHPKAPKSEWEGAALRNSRVNCNVILPLVSSRSSDVPLVAVDSALTEYQTAVNNLTGSSSKFSMLWTVLHDVRFLLLRMAHGESLNADCGGGSLSSNAQLIFHQLMMGDMFLIDAQVDTPETAQHVRNLSAGFLAACSIVHAPDYKGNSSTSPVLTRAIADAAPMAALTCILTRNNRDDYSSGTDSSDSKPHPKRRWIVGRKQFLRGLVICAGRRHALGIETSGCISGRGGSTSSSGPRGRSSSFPDWDSHETEATNAASAGSTSAGGDRKVKKRSAKPDIDDFGIRLRPMITLFAILDQLSDSFVVNMKDPEIEESAGKIVNVLEQCNKAKDIRELLETCKATFLDQDEILDDFQRGMMAA